MEFAVLVWSYVAILAALHFLGEELDEVTAPHKERITSFTTGVMVAYVFLQLLPEHHRIVTQIGDTGFIFALAGFSSIHIAEKYISLSDYSGQQMRKKYKELHSVFLFLYHGAIGTLIAALLSQDVLTGTLFFIPIALHTAISSFSLTELHEDALDNPVVKTGISLAPLMGAAAYLYNIIVSTGFQVLLGVVTGMFIYVVLRDAIPDKGAGKPWAYLAGTLFYGAVILATWTIL